MPIYSGTIKEDELIFKLNGKQIKDLSNNLRTLLSNLYGPLNDDSYVVCKKLENSFKADFSIEIEGRSKTVSMKSGHAEMVHNEILENFIAYLAHLGISERTLDTIKLFHYGDGTTDGTGNVRKGYQDVAYELRDRIKEANIELNKNKDVVLNVLNHCVFKGANSENIEADSIYFGTAEYGIVASKKQIISHIKRRTYDFYHNLHIGPLLMRPDARYVNGEIVSKRKRQRIVIYWPNLSADIEYIAHRYDY
jgi:hypothetical protein